MKTKVSKYAEKRAVMPLLCWDIYSQMSNHISNAGITDKNKEISQLTRFANKFNWQNNIKKILTSNNYEALVLTDASKKIMWVNDGFTEMTGYSKEFAKDKQPTFLQGKESAKKRAVIRKKLSAELPFKEVIINYRKDGTPYNCEIYIIPLKTDKTTHYLALERAV